jgi:hypothetical protein
MPFVLLIIGSVLLISSVRNTYGMTTPSGGQGLGALLQGDFTGQANFIYWIISLLIIGAVGYIPKLRPISIAFLTLVILALFLTKGNPKAPGGGFFQQFTAQVGSTTSQKQVNATNSVIGQLSGAIGLGNMLPTIPNIGS